MAGATMDRLTLDEKQREIGKTNGVLGDFFELGGKLLKILGRSLILG